MTYTDAAKFIEQEYGIIMQQRRKRHCVPVAQYQLLWGEVDNQTVHYVTLKSHVTPEQICEVARHIAQKRNMVRE